MRRRISLALSLAALLVAAAVASTPLTDRQRAIHFLNRAGFGPRPGQVETVEKNLLFMYVQQQLHPELIDDSVVDARVARYPLLRMTPYQLWYNCMDEGTRKSRLAKNLPVPEKPENSYDILRQMISQKIVRAVDSNRQLQEVMVDFWENHFNVTFEKGTDRWLMTQYERDVIRPHAMGRFRDLLGAVAHSPAMLFYLDNWVSKKNGINENYARELMELHTLGVDGGYTQKDVDEVARCLTGWTIDSTEKSWAFIFRPNLHDTGAKSVLGVALPANGGEDDGERVLDILARHPSTARFLATKLCRRFVCDDPPPALVTRTANAYLRSDGDIRFVLQTIFEAPEFWQAASYRAKVKTPLELVASAMRAVNVDPQDPIALDGILRTMGMGQYVCEPPTGYKDVATAWVSTGELVDRLNFCLTLSQNGIKGIKVDVKALAGRAADPIPLLCDELLGGDVSDDTRNKIESLPGADLPHRVGLLLGSPDFQRR